MRSLTGVPGPQITLTVPARPEFLRLVRLMVADAKTSGVAPWRICAASASEPANEYRSSPMIASPYSGNASVSEAAAETVSSRPLSPDSPESSSSLQPPAQRTSAAAPDTSAALAVTRPRRHGSPSPKSP